MKIYNYNSKTGEFLSESEADLCPVTKTAFLIPANATTKQPLKKEDGKAVVFADSKWKLVPDNRGAVFWDSEGKEYVMDSLGEIPEWALLEQPVEQKQEEDTQKPEEPKMTPERIEGLRRSAYVRESDPLMAQYLRGEVEKQVWLDKVAEIRTRYPKEGE